MKIRGQVPTPKPNEFMVIPRPEGGIPFEARPLEDWAEFNKLVQAPLPPAKLLKGGQKEYDYENLSYRAANAKYLEQQTDYMVIVSLEPSEIEWDNVILDQPKTWCKWKDDFEKAGFTIAERNAVFQLVLDANTLDELKMKAAREAFIHGQANRQAQSSGQSSEQSSTPSGAPANASE